MRWNHVLAESEGTFSEGRVSGVTIAGINSFENGLGWFGLVRFGFSEVTSNWMGEFSVDVTIADSWTVGDVNGYGS